MREPTGLRGALGYLRRRIKRGLYMGAGRDRDQQPERVVGALGLEPGQRVADLGAGSGYFTARLARAVSPGGRVYAVDTDRDILHFLHEGARHALSEVVPVLAAASDPALPEPVDLVFLSHSFHHIPERRAYFARLRQNVRTGGCVAIVEARPGGRLRGLFGHSTPPHVIREDLEASGYRMVADHAFLKHDSFQLFTPTEATARNGPGTELATRA